MSDDNKLIAAIEFIKSTGARQIQVRYSDDEEPTIWFVVALYPDQDKGGFQKIETGSSGLSPYHAALTLCMSLCDKAVCSHCHKACGFEADRLDRMPLDQLICWFQYDPELKTFRRGCE